MLKTTCIAVLGVFALLGCANQRFELGGAVPETAAANSEESQPFFVTGLGQKAAVDAAKACGGASKVRAVDVEQTPVDVLFGVVTLGVYTPRTARVYCR